MLGYIGLWFWLVFLLCRKSTYYVVNVVAPCMLLSALALLVFLLPPDSGEKVTLGITVLLSFTVFLLLVAENVPKTSECVPLLGKPHSRSYLRLSSVISSFFLVHPFSMDEGWLQFVSRLLNYFPHSLLSSAFPLRFPSTPAILTPLFTRSRNDSGLCLLV